MKFLNGSKPLGKSYCSIEPVTTAALIAGGGALLGGGLNFLGGSNQAKSSRAAMERYLAELQNQRNLFLSQPEAQGIRQRLNEYLTGTRGYEPTVLAGMKSGAYEDYGKSMADMTRLTKQASVAGGGAYTPGRADRTSRLLSQNIASNRASMIRDINQKNADVAMSNERFAVSAMPTYLPGTPSTTVAAPDVYGAAGFTPSAGSYFGPAVQQGAQSYANFSVYGPIMQRMLESQQNNTGLYPLILNGYNLGHSPATPGYDRLFPTQ